jgi:hypothetical protein
MKHSVEAPVTTFEIVTRFRPTDYLLTIICTMRATLVANDACQPWAKADQPPARAAKTFDDGIGNSPTFGGDYAPYKPRTDVTLMGSGYVPGGRKATALQVTFGVGAWRKSLDIVGDQLWVRALNVALSPPKPFASMQLRFENAFGGIGSPYNPWGKGFGVLGETPGSMLAACNIHPAQGRHARWDSKVAPAGFGPLPEDMAPRLALRGTYDEVWLYKRRPLPPEDFDWGFYNAAPMDQQFSPYLIGDEQLFFENLHPRLPQFSSRLPGLRLRILIRRVVPGRAAAQIEELHAVLDSVHVDMDTMTVDLAWHAATSTGDEDASDVTHSYVVSEALEDPPRPLAALVAAFEALLAPQPPPATAPLPRPAPEQMEAPEPALLRALQAQLGALPLSAAFKAALAAARTPGEVEDAVTAENDRTVTAIEHAAARYSN